MNVGNSVGEAPASSVGTSVGVASSNTGDVPAGAMVGKLPVLKGVSAAEGRGGFCQMYTNNVPRRHNANAPQPSPPNSIRSKAGRYFLRDSINSLNEKQADVF